MAFTRAILRETGDSGGADTSGDHDWQEILARIGAGIGTLGLSEAAIAAYAAATDEPGTAAPATLFPSQYSALPPTGLTGLDPVQQPGPARPATTPRPTTTPYTDIADQGMLDWALRNADPATYTGGGSSTGTSSGGAGGLSAYEQQQRELTRMFDQLQLEQDLKDIRGAYRPELRQSAGEIAEEQTRAAKDAGLYTSLLREVIPSFRGAGRLTATNLANAKAALAESDAARRLEIDRSYASATGRARAMVVAVSGDSPEMVDELTAGMDELNAFVEQGLAREAGGQQALAEASAELARAAAGYGLATVRGEIVQEREKTRIQYENTINDMLAERQSMLDARRAALNSAREQYALDTARQAAQWALTDAQRTGGGSGTGSSGSAEAARPDYEFGGLPVNQEDYMVTVLGYALEDAGIPQGIYRDGIAAMVLSAVQSDWTAPDMMYAAISAMNAAAGTPDAAYATQLVNYLATDQNYEMLFGAAEEGGSVWATHLSTVGPQGDLWDATRIANWAATHGDAEPSTARGYAEHILEDLPAWEREWEMTQMGLLEPEDPRFRGGP